MVCVSDDTVPMGPIVGHVFQMFPRSGCRQSLQSMCRWHTITLLYIVRARPCTVRMVVERGRGLSWSAGHPVKFWRERIVIRIRGIDESYCN
jgi:hypothetical protein